MPQAVADLDSAPPADFGRPGFVRVPARVGAWAGALVGAVGSIALLPITYPISLLADEPLGYSKTEFLFAPVSAGASAGHFVLGATPDALHFVFYRAWTDPEPPLDHEFTPMLPPVGPDPESPPGTGPQGAPEKG